MWLLIHPYFGGVNQCIRCNVLEVVSLINRNDYQSFPMNCKLLDDDHWLYKNLQDLSPRPAYLIALKAFPWGHITESWDNSVVSLCGDWAESNVMAPSTVPRTDEITNASEIFFICATTDPLDCYQVRNEAPFCQIWEIACISEQKLDLCLTCQLLCLH